MLDMRTRKAKPGTNHCKQSRSMAIIGSI